MELSFILILRIILAFGGLAVGIWFFNQAINAINTRQTYIKKPFSNQYSNNLQTKCYLIDKVSSPLLYWGIVYVWIFLGLICLLSAILSFFIPEEIFIRAIELRSKQYGS